MTISSAVNKGGPYPCDGVNQSFAYPFKIYDKNDIAVIHTGASGVETVLTVDVDYTVNDVGADNGTIDTTLVYPNTDLITIIRDMDLLQEVDLVNQGGFYPDTLERALDELVMITQQFSEELGRSIKVGASSSSTPDDLIDDINAAVLAAETAQTGAETAQTGAETAETNAETAETGAVAARLAAETAETNAETAEANAEAAYLAFVTASSEYRNRVFNGGMDIFQRSPLSVTLGTAASDDYTLDRWLVRHDGTYEGTVSQETLTPGAAGGGTYYQRVTCSAGGVATLCQPIENVRTLAGETATLSFWARAGSAHSMDVDLRQEFGAAGSTEVTTAVGTFSVTTSWQQFEATVTVPSISGKTIDAADDDYLELIFELPAGTGTFDITDVQLEAGPAATAFERRPVTVEQALCQRYFYITDSVVSGAVFGGANASATVRFPTTLRTSPTVTASHSGGGVLNSEVISPSYYERYVNDTTITLDAGSYFDAEIY